MQLAVAIDVWSNDLDIFWVKFRHYNGLIGKTRSVKVLLISMLDLIVVILFAVDAIFTNSSWAKQLITWNFLNNIRLEPFWRLIIVHTAILFSSSLVQCRIALASARLVFFVCQLPIKNWLNLLVLS